MDAMVTEHIQSPEGHNPKPENKKFSFKFNKYVALIIILAIIFTLFFLFRPHGEVQKQEIPQEEQPVLNETPKIEEIQLGERVDADIVNVILQASTAIENPFSLSFDINNTKMNDSIENAIVYVKIDDSVVFTKSVAEIAVNKTANFGFTFLPDDEFYPSAGDHDAIILLNGYQLYEQGFTITQRIIAPNLEIRSFSSTPVTGIDVNEEVTLTAYVRNVGLADAANATVRFYVNDVLVNEQSLDIAQQITTPFKTGWTPTEAGDYRLKVAAYASGDVYTDNNEYEMTVTVIEPAA